MKPRRKSASPEIDPNTGKAWVRCPDCDSPLLPIGVAKRPNEYDHAQGCPRDPVSLTSAQRRMLSEAHTVVGAHASGSGLYRTARNLKARGLVTISPWSGETRTTGAGAEVLDQLRRLQVQMADG